MQQQGNEPVEQMVIEAFNSLGADVRILINRETRKGATVALAIASFGILICGTYLFWSNSPDKEAALIPLAFFVLLAIFGFAIMLGFVKLRKAPCYKKRLYGFSSPNTFNPIDYGHADAVLTNSIMDYGRD
jgi:apolipoprotein N-acyltransferase